jgi:hypothetical protein
MSAAVSDTAEVKSEDKKQIENEEREKMLNEENKKTATEDMEEVQEEKPQDEEVVIKPAKREGEGEVEKMKKALEESEKESGKKKIPIGGIKMPGFLRSRSREKTKVRMSSAWQRVVRMKQHRVHRKSEFRRSVFTFYFIPDIFLSSFPLSFHLG